VSFEGNNVVAIIGGGLAGLACAHALKQRGVETVIYESSRTVGGRSDAGVPYLLGRELFFNTFRLIEELGLASAIVPIAPYAGQVYRGKIYHHRVASATGLLRFKGLNLADKALLARMAFLLARYSSLLDFHHPERGVSLDDETVASFIKRELSQNILNQVAGPLISTLFFYGSDETSRLLYLLLARHMHNTEMSTIRGLSERLANEARIIHENVGAIAVDQNAYLVNGRSFSNVVMAVNGDAVLKIKGMADLLSEEDQKFFSDCHYQRVVNVAVRTARPVDGSCYAVSIPRIENMSVSTISFIDYIDPARVAEGEGLLVASGGGPVTPEQLLADVHKLYDMKETEISTHEWTSGMPKFSPGRYRQIAAFKKRSRRPGLVFCGDYLMGPFIEAAVTTGLRAAAEVISDLHPPIANL
jgi:protoporphyrinogen/coproporphyrinogen III oxidase